MSELSRTLLAALSITVFCLSLIPTGNAEKTTSKCGIRNVGGVDAGSSNTNQGQSDFGEFPWTIEITNSNDSQYVCVGSLIHPKVVLTAGQCTLLAPPEDLIIRAGVWDRVNRTSRLPYQERRVEKAILHPSYGRYENDFALILLKEPMELSSHINVICLPPSSYVAPNMTNCFVSGWGQTLTEKLSRKMKRVILSTVDLEICERDLFEKLDKSVICALGDNENDTGTGDSGAPLVSRVGSGTPEQYQQIGITSFGLISFESLPGGYANVAHARSWIDEVMTANSLDTSSYTL